MRVLFCTTPVDRAEEIAGALVEARVAACVNVLPAVRSIYRWKGEIERDDEALLVIKTTAGRVQDVIELVRRIHPYEVPEVIALPIRAGLPEYLEWLRSEVEDPP